MSDEQKTYKDEIKEWLKQRNLNAAWLASWVGKSEGTVKNWLYGKIVINDKNKELIDNVIARFNEKLIDSKPNDKNKTLDFVSTPVSCYLGYYEENTVKILSSALRIPSDMFQESFDSRVYDDWEVDRYTSQLRRWVTDSINKKVKETLRAMKESFDKQGIKISVVSLECATFKSIDCAENGQIIDDGTPIIRIIPNGVNPRFIAIASAYDGEMNATAWINQILRETAEEELTKDFLNYLKDDDKRDSFDSDGEIPF